MARARKLRYREIIESDLEILPLMNLFVVLIPIMLLSAVFLELSVIKMEAPGQDDEAVHEPESLDLAVYITDTAYEVTGRGLESTLVERTTPGLSQESDPGVVVNAEEELSRVLTRIVGEHPENAAVSIVSEPNTFYEEIIEVMDLTREVGLHQASLLAAD